MPLLFLLGWAKLVPLKAWLALFIVLAVITALLVARYDWIIQGRNAALETINQANQKAKDNAAQGSDAVERCYALGGIWDRAGGVCATPKPGG